MLTMVSPDLDEELTATEAANRIGVATGTIYTWVKRGHLQPCDMRGKSPVYRMIDILRAARDTRHRAIGRNRVA